MRGISENEDGTWTARVKVEGKRRQKTFRSRDAALAWRQRQKGETASGATKDFSVAQRTSGRYQARLRYKGFSTARTFDTVEQAEAWRLAAIDAIDTGQPIPEPNSAQVAPEPKVERPETVGQLLDYWHTIEYDTRLANGSIQPETVSGRKGQDRHIREELGAVRIEELSPEQVRAFVKNLAAGGSAMSSQRSLLRTLRELYKLAQARGWVNISPAYGVRPEKPAKKNPHGKRSKNADPNKPVANRSASGKTIAYHPVGLHAFRAMTSSLHPDDALAGWFQRLMGMRLSETYGLTLGSIDINRRLVRIETQGGRSFLTQGEDGSITTSRLVPWTKGTGETADRASKRLLVIPEALAPYVEAKLTERQGQGAGEDDPLFTPHRDSDGPGSSATFSQALKRVSSELMDEGTHLRPHDLRKNLATQLDANNVKSVYVSLWLGHETTPMEGMAAITSATYVKNLRDDNIHIQRMREVAAAIDAFTAEELDGEPLVLTFPEDEEWLTIAEAGEILGMGRKAVAELIRSGTLLGQKRIYARNRRNKVWHVAKSEVEEYTAAVATGVTSMCARYDLIPSQVRIIAEASGIELIDNRNGPGSGKDWWVFTDEGAEQFHQVMADREAFFSTHRDGKGAQEFLDVRRHQWEQLLKAGAITEVQPPVFVGCYGQGSGGAKWYSQTDLDDLLPRVIRRYKEKRR